MSEDILHALRIALATGLATDLSINRMAEEIVDTLGIPAATLAGLRAGTLVPMPSENNDTIRRAVWRAQFEHVRNLKCPDQPIERAWELAELRVQNPEQRAQDFAAYRAMLAAAKAPSDG